MQVTETATDGLRHEFKIVIPAADIERKVQAELTKLSAKVRLPGFRPGKIPMPMLRKRYGKSVMGEVLEGTVNEGTQKAIEDRNLRPALKPKVEVTSFDEGKDLEYTVAVEVLPTIDPVDLTQVSIERPVAEVDDAVVAAALEKIAAGRKRFEPTDEGHKAETGNVVVMDFEGSLEGGPVQADMSGKDHRLELGSGRFIPGFEDQLVGAAAGEHRAVDLTFPEDYTSKDHAGKAAHFEVDVKKVERAIPYEIDETLAKDLGFEGLDGLRDAVKTQTEQEFGRHSRLRAKRLLLDRLAELVSFPVPTGMVDLEFDQIWRQVDASLKDAGDDNPDKGKPEDQLRAEYRAIAERRVRLGLLFAEIGKGDQVEVTQEELNRALIAEARRYPGQEQQVIEFFRKNPQAIETLRAPIYEEKVVDLILGRVNVTDKTVSQEELMRDPDEDEPGSAAAAAPVAETEATPAA
jgi:trigger factor